MKDPLPLNLCWIVCLDHRRIVMFDCYYLSELWSTHQHRGHSNQRQYHELIQWKCISLRATYDWHEFIPEVPAPTTTTFFPSWSDAFWCWLECKICPLKFSYYHRSWSNIGYIFDAKTYHSRINRCFPYTQTSRENEMVDGELSFNAILSAFNCDIPLVGVWVLWHWRRSGGCPDVQFEHFCVVF